MERAMEKGGWRERWTEVDGERLADEEIWMERSMKSGGWR
ncbi:hypothetical protein A2U01_0100262 [Trifolium medium]|uniref:Uncharacterized protein n=1 Tax=Trifolium medium TaxID=97028 RepID=A0A392UVS5_9FABA|nr:hypothetical protein [Trifolium medium]